MRTGPSAGLYSRCVFACLYGLLRPAALPVQIMTYQLVRVVPEHPGDLVARLADPGQCRIFSHELTLRKMGCIGGASANEVFRRRKSAVPLSRDKRSPARLPPLRLYPVHGFVIEITGVAGAAFVLFQVGHSGAVPQGAGFHHDFHPFSAASGAGNGARRPCFFSKR